MKKKLFISILFFLIVFFTILIFFSTIGYETNRFNKILLNNLKKIDTNLLVKVDKIKIKINVKNFSLSLSTLNPNITYSGEILPIKELSVYLNILSLISSEIKPHKVQVNLGDAKVSSIQKIMLQIKPSNFKSFSLNNISQGAINGNIDLTFDKKIQIKSYKIAGSIKNTNIEFNEDIKISDASFNFIADNDLVLINSINTQFEGIPISNGNININRNENLIINGFLNTEINFNEKKINKILKNLSNNLLVNNKIDIEGNALNSFSLNFDKTLKLIDYNFETVGKLNKGYLKFNKPFVSNIFKNNIENINLKKTKFKFISNKNNNNILEFEGNYLINKDSIYQKFKIVNNFKKNISKLKLDFDFNEAIYIDILNYNKSKKKTANIVSNLIYTNKNVQIKNFEYKENKNLITLEDIILNKSKQIIKLKKIKIKTYNNHKENNNFEIKLGEKLTITGSRYDGKNIVKSITQKGKNTLLDKINKDVIINLANIETKLSRSLKKFNLIGKIENGKFIKLISKSEISDDEYLDISLKQNNNSKQKTLEIYSDIPQLILEDYKFFKGLEGGKLLFTSIYDKTESSSKLEIEKFKVRNAPAFAKLLALADLGGMADLISGKGMSFERMEINFLKNEKILKIDEIFAVGPSISILMEGYVDNKSGLVSLRGTMVPAKNLNKMISKIPILGDILIPKEIGEGLFGVSFKMKGLPEELKTSVNPIKTLTPRFITKALEKNKKAK